MGKVKNMAWDEAENYLDKLIKQIKNKTTYFKQIFNCWK